MQLFSGIAKSKFHINHIIIYVICTHYMHACMYTYIHTYIHTYKQTHTHAHSQTHIHACIHKCTFIHACIHTYTYIHSFIRTYIHTYIHTYIYTHIHTHIHIYMHTYIHSYTHTYIHMHTYIHRCTCIHICMHTHTYPHARTHGNVLIRFAVMEVDFVSNTSGIIRYDFAFHMSHLAWMSIIGSTCIDDTYWSLINFGYISTYPTNIYDFPNLFVVHIPLTPCQTSLCNIIIVDYCTPSHLVCVCPKNWLIV